MTDETPILLADRIFKWDGPKRKQTVFKAHLGRLVLTDRRLIFLSSGSNDLSVGKLAAGGVSPVAVLRVSGTDSLDLSAANAPGGLDVPRDRIRDAKVKGLFKYLVITFTDDNGSERAATFAPKNGVLPGVSDWVVELTGRPPT